MKNFNTTDIEIIETGNQSGTYHSYKSPRPTSRTARERKRFRRAMAKCLALALVFGTVSGGTYTGIKYMSTKNSDSASATTTTTSDSASTTTQSGASVIQTASTSDSGAATVYDVSGLTAQCMPSIVAITCVSQEEYLSMFGQAQLAESESAGSGILIAEDDDYYYIATNNHVVEGVSSLTVTFCDDTTAEGTIKGTDSENDLAVVMVDKSQLSDSTKAAITVATLGDSTDLSIGSSVMAIGNALGNGQSVTTGVISALDRQVTTSDSTTGQSVTNSLIQTDAAINPGNSGGALFNMNGQVIGINSSKYSSTEVEGMGYAIPISTAIPILSSIIQSDTTADTGSSSDSESTDQNTLNEDPYASANPGYYGHFY